MVRLTQVIYNLIYDCFLSDLPIVPSRTCSIIHIFRGLYLTLYCKFSPMDKFATHDTWQTANSYPPFVFVVVIFNFDIHICERLEEQLEMMQRHRQQTSVAPDAVVVSVVVVVVVHVYLELEPWPWTDDVGVIVVKVEERWRRLRPKAMDYRRWEVRTILSNLNLNLW